MKIISWNIAHGTEPWKVLVDGDADVALLQEAAAPPPGVDVELDDAPWGTAGGDSIRKGRTTVLRLSDRVKVEWRAIRPIAEAGHEELRVSLPGTLAVADAGEQAKGDIADAQPTTADVNPAPSGHCRCRQANDDNARFCKMCGAALR